MERSRLCQAAPVPEIPDQQAIPALQALGVALRQGREAQGLDVPQLARRLNMGVEQLRALEEGNAARLPEPVFVIAQARRVANSLSICVDGPLQELRSCEQFQAKPLRVDELQLHSPARVTGEGAEPVERNQRSGPALPWPALGAFALTAGVLAALFAGGRLGWQQWQQWQARQAQTNPARPLPAQPRPSAQPPVSTNPSNGTAPGPAAPAGPGVLVLSSSKPSWLEVKGPRGAVLFRGTFSGERSFPLKGELAVLAGRPDLVLVRQGNAPARPLGPIDQVRWQRFKAPAP